MKKLTLGRKIGLTFAWLLPALWLGMGLLLWLPGSSVLTVSFAVAYLLLPALTMVLLYRIIRRGWHPAWRGFACIALLVAAVLLGAWLMTWGHFSLYDCTTGADGLDMYEEDIGASLSLLPEIDELGEPERIEYHYFYNQIALFFDSDCYTLICTYSPEDYAERVAALETQYVFHTESLYAGREAERLEPLYTLDGYRFRFLEMNTETYDLQFPHYMVLVGTNDETREIVWSYYSDDDLDYIDDPAEFLLKDCGWKFIR